MRFSCLAALAVFTLSHPPLVHGGEPGQPAGWSSSHDVLEMSLDAPLWELFEGSQGDPDYEVAGQLTYRDPQGGQQVTIAEVKVSTRGHTSRQAGECDFPKLKLDFKSGTTRDTLFAGTGEVKLGTHCADRPDEPLSPKFGRLANEKAPHREALVYSLLRAAGVPTLLTRPARIAYTFTDAPTPHTPLVRNALIVEDDKEARQRLGAAGQLAEDRFTTARDTFSEADTARLSFAQAMVGNFDWCLRFFDGDHYRCNDRHPLWNILGLHTPAWALPLPYDFDLAGIVVGRHVWFDEVFDASFLPSASAIEVGMVAQLQRTRTLFSREQLDRTRGEFLGRRQQIYQAIGESVADDEGKRLAAGHVDAFFEQIASDVHFYRPAVVSTGTAAFSDSAGAEPACSGRNMVPGGTPIGPVIEEKGGMIRTRLLDAMWYWAPPRACSAVREGTVWLPRSGVSGLADGSGSQPAPAER